jgi:hypothetical protein
MTVKISKVLQIMEIINRTLKPPPPPSPKTHYTENI